MCSRSRPRSNFPFVFLTLEILFLVFLCSDHVHATRKPKTAKDIKCKKNEYGNLECVCPDDPITERYPDVKDPHCEYYFLCHFEKAYKLRCPPMQAFHPDLQECMERKRIPTNLCKPMVKCPFFPNSYVEDPKDCTKYYLCYFGQHSHWSCPEDEYFDPREQKCEEDKEQADACIETTKRNYYKIMGFQRAPPVTSIALDEARAYLKKKGK